jgi:hypothetical protein
VTNYVLEPGNPFDFTRDELDAIAAEIGEQIPNVDVSIKLRDERGYGVSLVEVMRISTEVADAVKATAEAAGVIALIVAWMRSRWNKDRKDHPDGRPRPRSVVLYGPNGEILRSVQIDAPDGAPVEEEGGDIPSVGDPPPEVSP